MKQPDQDLNRYARLLNTRFEASILADVLRPLVWGWFSQPAQASIATMSRFAKDLRPPYYAVIFSNQLRPDDQEGYGEMSEKMVALAETMPGFLGIETTRDDQNFGITVSYWRDEAAILNWKQNLDHQRAQAMGKSRWYQHYELRVARIDRAYSGPE